MSTDSLEYRWIEAQGEAFGAPGLPARWTSSTKDVVGTAYAVASRMWFTVSHGIVNEMYYPTIDRPQVRDLELLVTDGETFAHEEKRDFDREFAYIDGDAPAVRLTNSDREGRYRIVKEVIADPHAPVLLMHVRLEGDPQLLPRLRVYALLAPHLEVGGAGNSARVLEVAGQRLLLAWKGRTTLAMGTSCGFVRTSCGFVGTSDGWQDVMKHLGMTWEFGSARDGNVAVIGEVDVSKHAEFTLAVGFGEGPHAALTSTLGALTTPFEQQEKRFIEQWKRTHIPSGLIASSGDGGRLLKTSHHVLLAHEDKTFAGAFIASASIPWGQAKGDADLGGYHLVWTRDMVQSATALLAAGQEITARRALVYLACTQKPDGGFAQNFWVDGTAYWSGVQLDETAFPIILAWRLWKGKALGDFDPYPFVERAAGFLVRHAPVTQQERWEENAGYSPSTLAVVLTGLVCAAEMAREHQAIELARFLEEQADWIESHLEDWTVTNAGVLLPGVERYYMRIRPPEQDAPYVAQGPGTETIRIANRAPDEKSIFEAREIVDGGFLELVRYGVRRADDPIIVNTVKVVDAVLKRDLPQGPGYRRYNHDGYGQQKNGRAFKGFGQGGSWPMLTGERAHYALAAGEPVAPLRNMMEQSCSTGGMLPEQLWDLPDLPARGMLRGQPSGSAMPLVWAHAEYLKLLRSIADGKVFDTVSAVADRYANGSARSGLEVWRLDRQVRTIPAGKRLRVEAEEMFELTWSIDNWATVNRTGATPVGFAGFFADLQPDPHPGQKIVFTLRWTAGNRWEGKNFEVETAAAT